MPCPPEWVTWLQESFIVPGCLVPHGGNDLLPDGTERTSLRLFGPDHGLSGALIRRQLLTEEQKRHSKMIRVRLLHTIYFVLEAQMWENTGL